MQYLLDNGPFRMLNSDQIKGAADSPLSIYL